MDTISTQQLAELARLDPSWFAHNRQDLPHTVTVRNGQPGRPAKHFDLAELADFAMTHTAHLSDAECRLICAIRQLAAGKAKGDQP